MKKTDLYTKIVLTVIAVFLGVLVFKDVSFVTKAQANDLNLSDLKIEQAEKDEDITLFIYENSEIEKPFSYEGFSWERNECKIGREDMPKYIITSKTGKDYNDIKIRRWVK